MTSNISDSGENSKSECGILLEETEMTFQEVFLVRKKKIKVLNVLVHEKGYRENMFCTSADEGKRKYAAISLQMMTENRASYLILSHFYF